MSVPEKRHSMSDKLARVVALQKATEVVGQAAMADGLSVAPRTLRAYLGFDRGLSDATLMSAADVLDAKCAELAARAAKLRALAGVADGR